MLLTTILAAIVAAAAAPAEARLLNLPDLVTWEDYPAASVMREEEGSVRVRLVVGADGAVTSCKVTESSGHAALDEQTCAIFRARALFDPATDGNGRAVAADFTQRVQWKLEGEMPQPLPRSAWTVRTTLSMSADGRLTACKVEKVGIPPGGQECDELLEAMREIDRLADEGEAVAGQAITETHFYPILPTKSLQAPNSTEATQVAQQISEVEIGRDGRVTACKGVRYSGAASEADDACRMMRLQRFVPAPDTDPLRATMIMTAYTRKQSIT